MSLAWQAALRRGRVPLLLGVACLVLVWPATADLERLLGAAGALLLVLGAVIVVATARTLSARESRVDTRP